jgi:hypothetical protein
MNPRRLSQAKFGSQDSRLDRAGQSTLEFVLTLLLLMAFVLFYLQLSMMMAFGNYVHYATFMSARALLSAGPDQTDQESRAKDVLTRMVKRRNSPGLDRFPMIAKGEGSGDVPGAQFQPPSQFNPTNYDSSWMQGVRYTFRSRLFLMPMGGGGSSPAAKSANSVPLTSESWLGRDPSYQECQDAMGKLKGIFDNGC